MARKHPRLVDGVSTLGKILAEPLFMCRLCVERVWCASVAVTWLGSGAPLRHRARRSLGSRIRGVHKNLCLVPYNSRRVAGAKLLPPEFTGRYP